jgi:hypothetical protein
LKALLFLLAVRVCPPACLPAWLLCCTKQPSMCCHQSLLLIWIQHTMYCLLYCALYCRGSHDVHCERGV